VFTGLETSDKEFPCLRMTRWKLLQRMRRSWSSRIMCDLGRQSGGVCTKPAAAKERRYDEYNEKHECQSGLSNVVLQPREIAPEYISKFSEDDGSSNAT
jgi:hypothetical protein